MDSQLERLEPEALASELSAPERSSASLRELAGLFVPTMADWAVVDVIVGPQRVSRMAVIHRDAALAPPGRFEGELPRIPKTTRSSLAEALRSGRAVAQDVFVAPESADSDLHREQMKLFQELGARHALIVPMVIRDETLGAITLVRQAGPPFNDEEVRMIEGFARRSARAVDTARLHALHSDTSAAFQRALLPALPQPDHLRLTARYLPAQAGSDIGGDWYDAFVGSDGLTTLVIGDVVGHDQHASARMAEVRNLLRGCAWHAPSSPAGILDRLSEVIEGLDLAVLASVLCLRIKETEAGHDLVYANAGHLAPVVIEPDRPARWLPSDPGVLLGVMRSHHTDAQASIAPGSKLLLFTDGLVEHRGDIREGLDELLKVAGSHGSLGLEEFCDELIDHFAARRDDDIALLGVEFPPG